MFRLLYQYVLIFGNWQHVFALQSFDPVAPENSPVTYIGIGIEKKMSCANGYANPQKSIWLGQRVNAADGRTVHSIGIAWNCWDGSKQRYYLSTHEVSAKSSPTAPSRSPSSTQADPTGPTSQPTRFPTSQPTHQPTIQPTRQPTRQPTQFPSISQAPYGMMRALSERRGTGKRRSKVQDKGQEKSESAATATAAVAAPKKRLVSSSSSTSSTSSSAAAKRSKKAA
jgi:hypothetical protein